MDKSCQFTYIITCYIAIWWTAENYILTNGALGIINTLGPRQKSRHFTDDNFKISFFNENVAIFLKISLRLVPSSKFQVISFRALVQIMVGVDQTASHYLKLMFILSIYASPGLNELRDWWYWGNEPQCSVYNRVSIYVYNCDIHFWGTLCRFVFSWQFSVWKF